jgi:hypothetical protein
MQYLLIDLGLIAFFTVAVFGFSVIYVFHKLEMRKFKSIIREYRKAEKV